MKNVTWGHTRIRGAAENLGYRIGLTTVANISKEHGLDSADRRQEGMSWRALLKAHRDCLAALDFFTIVVWTCKGLTTYYMLLAMELAHRRVEIAGITPCPGVVFMAQVARNLTSGRN